MHPYEVASMCIVTANFKASAQTSADQGISYLQTNTYSMFSHALHSIHGILQYLAKIYTSGQTF